MQTEDKNNSIVIWRIIFTYMILFYHFDNRYYISQTYSLLNGWYIGVEFFFIISGYLLCMKAEELSLKYKSGLYYFVSRYKKYYPFYFGTFVIAAVLYKYTYHLSAFEILKFIRYDFFEAMLLHGIGLDFGWNFLNNTSWFISVLLLCGLIIYHCLLHWKEHFMQFAAPIIVVISFSFLYRNLGGIGAVVQTSGFYENWALIRGMGDMCLGVLAFQFSMHLRKTYQKLLPLKVIGVLGFLFVIIASLKYGNTTTDFLYAILIAIFVAIGFLPSESRIVRNRLIREWSRLTMCIYMVHDMFRTSIFPVIFGVPEKMQTRFLLLGLYFVTVTVFAWIYDKFIRWLTVKIQIGIINKLKKSGEDDPDAEKSVSIAG